MRLKPLPKAIMFAALAVPAVSSVQAQESADFSIEEIIVTAQKREASAQDVAVSMTVQTGEALDNIAAFDFKDISKLAPGLDIKGDDAISGSIKIRGVGKDAFTGSMDDSVVVFIDGVAQSSVGAAFGSLSDVERIEVLRGPQGTLYGKNAPAGAINVTTASVDTENMGGGFQSSHTYYDETSTYGTSNKFYVNVPLIEGVLGARVSGFYDDSEGYLTNATLNKSANDFRREGGRLKIEYTPTDTLSFKLIGNYSDNYNGRAFNYIPGFGSDFVAKKEAKATGTPNSSDTFASVMGTIPSQNVNSYEIYTDINAFSRTRLADGQLIVDWDVAGHSLTSLTYYQEVGTEFVSDQNGTPIGDAFLRIDTEQTLFTQEVRLANHDAEDFEYMMGLYYSKNHTSGPGGVSTSNHQYGLLEIAGGRADVLSEVEGSGGGESFAVFAHGTYHVNDEWHIDAGIRYNDERKYLQQSLVSTIDLYGNPSPDVYKLWFSFDSPSELVPSTNESYYNTSGSLKVRYTPGEDVMYYASVDTAYRSGGFNLSVAAPLDNIQEFDAEDSTAFELGMKGMFLDNTLQFNVALYYQMFKDYQFGDTTRQDNNATRIFTDVDPAVPVDAITLAQSHVLNAGEAISKGVEIDFLWLLSENLDISGAVTYIDAKYEDFVGFCDDGEGASNQQLYCDYSGTRIRSNFGTDPARWVANVQPAYHHEVESLGGEVFTRLQVNYDDVKHVNADLHVGFNSHMADWNVRLFVKNILERNSGEVLQRLAGNSTDTYQYDLLPPRQLGVSLGYNF